MCHAARHAPASPFSFPPPLWWWRTLAVCRTGCASADHRPVCALDCSGRPSDFVPPIRPTCHAVAMYPEDAGRPCVAEQARDHRHRNAVHDRAGSAGERVHERAYPVGCRSRMRRAGMLGTVLDQVSLSTGTSVPAWISAHRTDTLASAAPDQQQERDDVGLLPVVLPELSVANLAGAGGLLARREGESCAGPDGCLAGEGSLNRWRFALPGRPGCGNEGPGDPLRAGADLGDLLRGPAPRTLCGGSWRLSSGGHCTRSHCHGRPNSLRMAIDSEAASTIPTISPPPSPEAPGTERRGLA